MRGAARALAYLTLAGAGGMVLSGGCMADLPEALVCPPEAVYPGDNCVPALEDVQPGCFDLSQMACLTGPRTSCTCIADECPAPEEPCFPEGDCPLEVTEAAGGDATCVHLAPKDIGGGLPSEFLCLCGCAGCASVCDGRGPVLGAYNDGQVGLAGIAFDVGSYMPSSGRLGVYMRERGLSASLLIVMIGEPDAYEVASYYFISSPIGTAFTSQIFYDDPFLGTSEYRWSKAEDRPRLVLILPAENASSLMEIDCVVPFVVTD
ncbi:MAG: hypothetical protein R3B70_09640 [Polyangiaceae bacterium]